MPILTSLIKKETLHIVRDRRTMLITLLMPLALLLLFGFAISTEVRAIRIAGVADRHTERSREIFERLRVNEYFDFRGTVEPQEMEEALKNGSLDAVVVLKEKGGGEMESQIIVDASNTTSAQAMTGYIQSVLSEGMGASPVVMHTLYNPQMKSAYNFVPGIMGMIFILICAIMTSVSIVREKESGTMDLLLVSPVNPRTIIFGKLIPYFMLSCVILAVMLGLAYTVLGLPFTENVVNVVIVSLLYVVLSLAIGLLISTVVSTQLTALLVSAVGFMLPVIMLSGMIFPIVNMPEALQWISAVIPARWYISAMRKLMVQQLGWVYVMEEVTILLGMTVVLLALAVRKFQSNR